MASIQELKDRIDLHDLAAKLGIERPGGRGNYRSPHRDDKQASLSIFKDGKQWKDHGADEGGTCVDLVMYVKGLDVSGALRFLHELYGIPFDRKEPEQRREKTRAEFIADKCFDNVDATIAYLCEERKIPEKIVKRAIERKAVGFNNWESDKVAAGEPMHGGPAAAFIVRSINPGHVVAVDMRYLDPVLNGGVKTMCQGEKDGAPWFSDLRKIESAHTVYVVESPINALSIEAAEMPHTAAVATRGTGNVSNIDWRFLAGKKVIACMDNDKPFPESHQKAGRCPGQEASWELHELLTGLDIACLFVDQADWGEINDINDVLRTKGLEELKVALKKIESWLIPGLRGGDILQVGRPRVWLPGHDYAQYWRYRVKDDFTSLVENVKKDPDTGQETMDFKNLAGFRIAAVSRVTIASAVATMTGDQDSQPRVLFAVSVQVPRHGAKLLRRVVEDEKLHNVDSWKRFGPVFDQSQFLRMVNILERSAHIGARKAANFVGLCYKEGKLTGNEGPDCYFTNPEQQCPYHNLTFPSGTIQDARTVIEAYQQTFKSNAAASCLVWALGGHLKVLLGFWPHMMMQAAKGSGKSTLIKRLERSIAMTMFSGQSLQTEFRLLTSISHTSHPVGWEELSARRQDIIDKAVGILQESYQYTVNRRGTDLTEFLLSAPVLLAGEDVPVRSLIGKLIRTDLTGKKGPQMPDDLPRFPVRQWLAFLTRFSPAQVRGIYRKLHEEIESRSIAGEDEGGRRMVTNYAAVMTAWRLLCEFADIDTHQGDFGKDLLAEMNSHIRETSSDREPWVWIVETLFSEIARSEFRFPHKWDQVEGEDCLMIRTSYVMDHMAHTNALRDKWNGLPIKSDRVFKRSLQTAGVLVCGSDGAPAEFEKSIGHKREAHMVALSIPKLATYGLYPTQSISDPLPD